jgi:methyl acetate hydrolase
MASTSWASGVQQTLEAAVADRIMPGVATAVTGPDGMPEVMTAGTLSMAGDDAVGPDTMYRLMSMTKAFASVAAL